jgi:hypothetical protein
MVKYFKDNNIYQHTYQLKAETAYRLVLKYLHFLTDIEDIKIELGNRVTKEPLNLFFVDLEPAENNKNIYSITAIQNKL